MHFYYTNHARERMQKRKVTKFEIEQTILNPDNCYFDEDDPNKYHAVNHWHYRTLEIVYISKSNEIRITPAFVL